jgi:SAM-dependent methyltransferase
VRLREFINQVPAARKYGMDLNPATRARLAAAVEFLEQDCSESWAVSPGSLDLIFTSNFFEHLPDKDRLAECLVQAHRGLRPGGRLIALGPNIRVLNGRYWDFWDHHVPLTDLSLSEGLRLAGFEILRREPRFLPYTMSGGPRYPAWMVGAYIGVPLVWRLLGEQFLVVARRPPE